MLHRVPSIQPTEIAQLYRHPIVKKQIENKEIPAQGPCLPGSTFSRKITAESLKVNKKRNSCELHGTESIRKVFQTSASLQAFDVRTEQLIRNKIKIRGSVRTLCQQRKQFLLCPDIDTPCFKVAYTGKRYQTAQFLS